MILTYVKVNQNKLFKLIIQYKEDSLNKILITCFLMICFISFDKNLLAEECDSSFPCMEKKVLESAHKHKIIDQSSPFFGCMLQEWHANFLSNKSNFDNRIEVWEVFTYERFLACYRSNSTTGKVGELGVETEKRRVVNGTRFKAIVKCEKNICSSVKWVETKCCFNMDHEEY